MRTASLLLLLAGLLVGGCGASDGAASAEETATAPEVRVVRVEVQPVSPTRFEDIIQITGTIEAPQDAMLSAQTAGTVISLAPLGRSVSRGAVVAKLDDTLIQAALAQVKAQLDVAAAQEALAEDLFKRQEPLFADSIISAVEFESVRTQRLQARATRAQMTAAVAAAEKQLENTRVRAPFAGTVEARFAESGEQVQPGTQLLRVVNTRDVKITAGVPERYVSDIRVGANVTVRFQAYGVPDRTGRVSFASRVINTSNRTFRIEAELANRDGLLKPEMIAALLLTRARLEDQLVVPLSSVIRDEDGSSVYVVANAEDRQIAERRPVMLGASHGGRVVVTQGIRAGDEVIVVGHTNVTEGDAIEIADRRASF